MAVSTRLLLPTPEGTGKLQEILAAMKPDKWSLIAKTDRLILELGNKEYFKLGHDPAQHNYIRAKLRELARLVHQLREERGKPNACLEDFIRPSEFSAIVEATRTIAGFNENSKTYSTPSLAIKIGHSLHKCATIMRGNSVEKGQKNEESYAEGFLKLYDMKWSSEVASHAHRTLYQLKRNQSKNLPSTADLTTFSKYIQDLLRKEITNMKSQTNLQDSFQRLNEATLCHVISFNRRRQGEVSKMKVTDYKKCHKANADCLPGLNKFEQSLLNMFEVVELVGKKGRTVPVILTGLMKEAIDLLMKNRYAAGVSASNPHLFAVTRWVFNSIGNNLYFLSSDPSLLQV